MVALESRYSLQRNRAGNKLNGLVACSCERLCDHFSPADSGDKL